VKAGAVKDNWNIVERERKRGCGLLTIVSNIPITLVQLSVSTTQTSSRLTSHAIRECIDLRAAGSTNQD